MLMTHRLTHIPSMMAPGRRLFLLLVLGWIAVAAPIAPGPLAADLYDEDVAPRRSGTAYDDPRYADLYGPGRRVPPPSRVETYRPYDAAPIPRERVYRDDDYAPRRTTQNCPTKDEISQMLEADGWFGFRNPQVLDRTTATIDAQRGTGRPFRLELDRCTGEILSAHPLDQRYGTYGDGRDRFGPYADGRRQRAY